MSTSRPSFGGILAFPEEHRGSIIGSRSIPAERRSKARFPLDLSVRFRPLSSRFLSSGAGRAVNVSSSGLLVVSQHIVSQHALRVGEQVEMSIEWPSLLDGKIPLQLFAVGRVVRRRASDFAAAFERYQFRTMRSASLPQAGLADGVVQWPD
jgi:hypothetical protein